MNTFQKLLIVLFISSNGFAQTGINYKAVIKDNLGNVAANDLVTVQFTILQGVAQNNVYQESHTSTTDANGILIVNIGEGTTSNVFTDIDWGSDDHYLNVQINTGSGLIDLGTTQFMAVPYALNVTGLEKITENGNTGWRLKGSDSTLYGDIGDDAVDLSRSATSSSIYGATGTGSTALGRFTTASESYSTAMGRLSTASGTISTAMGNNALASGLISTAMGSDTVASGDYSTSMGSASIASGDIATAMGVGTVASGVIATSMGEHTTAPSYAETVFGSYNSTYTLGTNGNEQWNPTDRLFVIGNGTSNGNRSDAVTILKNGNIGIGKSSGINGRMEIASASGIASPQLYLHETTTGYSRLNFSNTNRIDFWAIGAYIGATSNDDRFNFYNSGVGADIMSIEGSGNVRVNGAIVHSSDRRLKKNITDLSYGLDEVLLLSPKAYHWKAKPNQKDKSIGLIAQDVQKIIKEVVHADSDNEKTLSISYTELIPVLIKALQEQQEIINKQNSKIESLTAEFNQKDETFKTFDQRLKQMEAIMKLNDQ